MKAKEIIDILNHLAPPFLIDSWDNSGLQIGTIDTSVNKILISLDLSKESLDLAIKNDVNMIVTHHPFLFTKLKNISLDDERGQMIKEIIKNDILVFSMHTNLDICEGGVNDSLCELLGINCFKPLSKFNLEHKDYGYGRIGELEKETRLEEFAKLVDEKLKCKDLRIYGNLDKKVKKVAVCGGSGASFIKDAYKEGADVYITGDIKYHDAQLALELGVCILDAGHFETERPCLQALKTYINNSTKDIEIITFEESLALFTTTK